MVRHRLIPALACFLASSNAIWAAERAAFTPDVVYGHKAGMALTFDVFPPKENGNGAGVLFMVSGGWYSVWRPAAEMQPFVQPLTDAGFTVFTVRHGSSPQFSIPEIVDDVRRSVRYIRANAARFGVDPERLGVYGMSAGGHLSLVLGTMSDKGDPSATDPILKIANEVQAVVAFVAPTDLRIMVWDCPNHLPAYEKFPALNLSIDEAEKYSPLVHVTPDDAPTLLIVGRKDTLVPMSHSQDIHSAFKEQNVRSDLVVFDESDHGLRPADMKTAVAAMVDWFRKHLEKR
ncbi:MAG: alpha/beta hydrolase [Planctomycetes bacterium]|nr:alpha/beta hydrolase [Planctomycetota bacterium]